MGFFKKLAKGVGKAAKKALKPAVRIAAASITSGASEAALRVAKGIGAFNAKKPVQKVPSVAVQALIHRTRAAAPAKKLKGLSEIQATTMPGGAPLKGIVRASKRRAKAPSSPAKAKTRRRKGGGGPSGGYDFKKLSQGWQAAGKPGTWREWISKQGSK